MNADRMFKKLEYKVIENENSIIICFDGKIASYVLCVINKNIKNITFNIKTISYREIKAINEKCKELRMALDMEIWKDIKGYEGLYQISNLGNVKSLKRYKRNHNKLQVVEEKQICKNINKTNGYVYVYLCNNGKYKNVRLHRIVAETFLENKNNLPQVNHIDGNKQNNRVDNLEWCTCKDNIKHAYKNGLSNRNNQKIKVCRYTMNLEFVDEFESLSEASKKTGVPISKISLCINDKYKYRNGKEEYIWMRDKTYYQCHP